MYSYFRAKAYVVGTKKEVPLQSASKKKKKKKRKKKKKKKKKEKKKKKKKKRKLSIRYDLKLLIS